MTDIIVPVHALRPFPYPVFCCNFVNIQAPAPSAIKKAMRNGVMVVPLIIVGIVSG